MAIVFPFSVDDKESNSSSGGDGKTKTSSTVAAGNNSNNSTSKTVNSNDKANSTSKDVMQLSSSNDQSLTNSAKSVDSGGNEPGKSSPTTKANNCDALSDVINNAFDTSGIKMEIKDDPDAPKVTKSVNNIQPALGGSLLPPHAADAKHPVSTNVFYFMLC